MIRRLIILLLIVGCGTEPEDCAGVAGGTAVEDNCGVCGGDNSSCTIISDIDGNEYGTVQIGDQLWMAENLKVTHYNNGDEIPTGLSSGTDGEWANTTEGAYAVYDDDPANADIYGNLYNWYAVNDSRFVCPDGWHVPKDAEYTVLTDSLDGISVAGGKMKECTEGSCPESDYWDSPNTGATNDCEFTGLPAGSRSSFSGDYSWMGYNGYFWSSSESDSTNAWKRNLQSSVKKLFRSPSYKDNGYSIRCLAD